MLFIWLRNDFEICLPIEDIAEIVHRKKYYNGHKYYVRSKTDGKRWFIQREKSYIKMKEIWFGYLRAKERGEINSYAELSFGSYQITIDDTGSDDKE